MIDETTSFDAPLWIGGEPEYGDAITIADPGARGVSAGTASTTSPQGVDRAVAAAAGALHEWQDLSPDARLNLLAEGLQSLDTSLLARVLTSEMGKTLAEAKLEVKLLQASVDWFRPHLGILEERRVGEPGDQVTVTSDPHGIIVMVLPWNWPLFQLAAKLVPALAAGNVAIIKPSPLAPLAIALVVEALNKVIPRGVVSTILGDVETTVRHLVTHRSTALTSFTGSVSTGRRIMALAAEGPRPVVLELGGNDAAVLLDDVVLNGKTFVQLMQSMFTTTGQGCQLIKRVLVHRSRFDELCDGLAGGIDDYYQIGHGLEAGVTLGPLVSEAQRGRVAAFVDDAHAHGATIVRGGHFVEGWTMDRGWYLEPTLVLDPGIDTPIWQEEQFGPAIPIVPFDHEEDAVELANGTPFALGSSVWSADVERAERVGRRLSAGATYLNSHNAFAVFRDTSVGGHGDSGIGLEWGAGGLAEYARPHVISDRRK